MTDETTHGNTQADTDSDTNAAKDTGTNPDTDTDTDTEIPPLREHVIEALEACPSYTESTSTVDPDELRDEIDPERMTADDWEALLCRFEIRLLINDPAGVHYVEYDDRDSSADAHERFPAGEPGVFSFFAYGTMGYDYEGTRGVLDEISEQPDGLAICERYETPTERIEEANADGEPTDHRESG